MSRMSSSDFTSGDAVKPGIYHVRWITDTEKEFQDKKNPGETYTKLSCLFEVVQGKQRGKQFTDLFSNYATENSKLGLMIKAILGANKLPRPLPENTEVYHGREFVCTVSLNDNGYNAILPTSFAPVEDEDEEDEPAPRRQRPANPEPLPQSLQPQRRPAPHPRQPEPEEEEYEIPAGYDDDAA
ncbi:MAG: hypothetical protein M3R02_05240 [Chloroflexota bacterium]|nr:hypothetical protein [Chloroflexota bacterium]